MGIFASFQAVIFQNAGFWRLKAPGTSIWAPEGALDRIPYIKGPKRQFVLYFSRLFSRSFGSFPRVFQLLNLDFRDFRMFLGRLFQFAILLRRGPGLGPGDRAWAWPGACEEGWKMFFFSTRVFQAVSMTNKETKQASIAAETVTWRAFVLGPSSGRGKP